MVYKKTEFTPEVENLLAEGLANMLGLFIVRKGLLWSVTNVYCKDGKWMADCILTTFMGIWLKNAGITDANTQPMAVDALKWAAYTYVIAAIGSLATLLYYIGLARRD